MAQPSCLVLARRPDGEVARRVHRGLGQSCDVRVLAADALDAGADCDCNLIIAIACAAELDADIAMVTSIRMHYPRAPVLVVGRGLGRVQISRVLVTGAYDYASADTSDDELVARVLRGIRFVQRDISATDGAGPGGLIGSSPAFLKTIARLPLLARCQSNVLIQGETGTGKELFAQAIHYLSGAEAHPWVPVNCGAIPHDLMEAELFGHTRGAYTSANFAREGLIAAAEGGTLFLDEIDSLALPLQSKLLRFLQEKEYRPVGANVVRHANLRVVAASNADLARAAAEGRFRQDLYFRLNVLNIRLPPLRDRRSDIPELAAHFLQRYAAQQSRPARAFDPAALALLRSLDWPGNVRELAHTIERAVLLSSGSTITMADLDADPEPAEVDTADVGDDSFQAAKARAVEQFERNYLERVLSANKGNISHAAKAAKKNRRALFELIRKYRIEAAQFRA